MSRFLPIAAIVLIAACAGDATALNDPTTPQLNTVSGFWRTTLQVRPADNVMDEQLARRPPQHARHATQHA